MGGIIDIVPPTVYDMSYLGLVGSGSNRIVLANAVPVHRFKTIQVLCRVHNNDIGSGASFSLEWFSRWPLADDVLAFKASSGGSLTIDQTSGELLSATAATGTGPYMTFELEGIPSMAGPARLFAELSVGIWGLEN